MTDAVATFHEEVNERTKLAKMDYHKKNGSAVSKLGSKQLTNQEIEERHGDVKIYDLKKFVNFDEFRAMPSYVQAEYLNYIQNKYDVGILQVSRVLFNLGDDNLLRSHLKIKGILKDVHPDKKRAKTGYNKFCNDVWYWRRGMTDGKLEEDTPSVIPKFMSYEEFKELSTGDKVIFINRLLDEYKVGISSIDMILFEHKQWSKILYDYLFACCKIDKDALHCKFGRGGHPKGFYEGLAKFKSDILEWKNGEGEAMCKHIDEHIKPTITVNEMAEAINARAEQLGMKLQQEKPRIWWDELVDASSHETPKEIIEATAPEMEVKEMNFSVDYISDEINIDLLKAINEMFRGHKIHVTLGVVVTK